MPMQTVFPENEKHLFVYGLERKILAHQQKLFPKEFSFQNV